ncbi:P-loop containing nucleoside triphosphate hydrolase protein [Dendryphion nanum]|uniref:P-loop containing nucleoside triphosphate hydrolase protein n=1 Tax=Dendryphion nanum TaxID=256645 RepID=A0A9P9I7L5_9PLEO|nr:P-loop containing nucleoside triphosphate hydrolase protein [Dendryphion nanum]
MSTRMLNLLSICLLLRFAESIHHIMVPEVVPSRIPIKDEDNVSMKETNPHILGYNQLFAELSDDGFIDKIASEIVAATAAYNERYRVNYNPLKTRPVNSTLKQVFMIVSASERTKALFANIAGQFGSRDEKAIIFCQHPIEQMLVTVILRQLGVRASALLSFQTAKQKEELIDQFNTPLNRFRIVAQKTEIESDVEVLVLNYAMNSGLNLQNQCCNVHTLSPAPSWAIWVQVIGRVVRFGQKRNCLIIEYFVRDTFNAAQIRISTSHALVSVAAQLNGDTQLLDNTLAKSREFLRLHDGSIYDINDAVTPPEVTVNGKMMSYDGILLYAFNIAGNRDISVDTQDSGAVKFFIKRGKAIVDDFRQVWQPKESKSSGSTPVKVWARAEMEDREKQLDDISSCRGKMFAPTESPKRSPRNKWTRSQLDDESSTAPRTSVCLQHFRKQGNQCQHCGWRCWQISIKRGKSVINDFGLL